MISVCIATHNGGRFIKEQLESILCQIGPYDEVVISDDGSVDNTLAIIREFNDSRVVVHRYTQFSIGCHPHEYVCKNFENALAHAKGEIIFLSDQDDIWMPNKVEVCLNDLKTCDLVLHDFNHIDENGRVTKELHFNGTFRSRNVLMLKGLYYGCAMAFKKQVLDYALPFPKHLLLHDYWIGILAEYLGVFYFEDTPLIRYRIHQNNTSDNRNSLWFKVYYRIYTILSVFCRIIRHKMISHHSVFSNE